MVDKSARNENSPNSKHIWNENLDDIVNRADCGCEVAVAVTILYHFCFDTAQHAAEVITNHVYIRTESTCALRRCPAPAAASTRQLPSQQLFESLNISTTHQDTRAARFTLTVPSMCEMKTTEVRTCMHEIRLVSGIRHFSSRRFRFISCALKLWQRVNAWPNVTYTFEYLYKTCRKF